MTLPVTAVSRPAPEPFEGRPPRSPAVRWLKRKLYPPQQSRYETLVRMNAAAARSVLTFGAGRGAREFDLRAPGREVVGVDVDRDVLENPYVNRALVYDGHTLPFPDATFDLCCTQWVIEHLPEPALTFAELARVLRPGGHLVFKTPNIWCYSMLISRLVPNRLHTHVLRFATGRSERDVFPTLYRANSRRRLRRLLGSAGFLEAELHVHLRGDGYLEFSLPTYLLGLVYERVVNASPLLEDVRGVIIGDFMRAPRP